MQWVDIRMYVSDKPLIYNNDISFINICVPNKTSTTFIKQKLQEMALIMGEINKALSV